MPYLNELVALINDGIRDSSLKDKRFSTAQLEGIAYQVARESTEGEQLEVFPAIVEPEKDPRYIGVDDTYPLIIYHRVLSNTYADDAKQSQYGDGFSAQVCSTDMLMVVFAKRAALKLSADQLEALLVSGFPDQFVRSATAEMQLTAKATLQASTMDVFTVFAGEYRNVKFFLGVEDILFSLKYKIESRYRKGCFKLCGDCE